jgi:lysophospholipase L1-like esterase
MLKLAFAAATALFAIPDDMPIPANVGGRVTQDMRFGWPGIYFEGRFTGTDVIVEVESGTEHFRVLVDGVERAVLTKPGRARLQITGLAAGAHVVRLEKLTESQSGGGRFLGFFTRTGQPLPLQRRARQIEFIGDSHSVGYGNSSATRQCTEAQVHDTTDTQRAFGPLIAKRLDADYRVTAYSGYGIVRNYAGHKPGENLPFLYDRAIPGESAPAVADSAWRPQVIVINLGTNDFSTPLEPGEAWADAAALRADYRARYTAFVRRLRASQPQARFLLMAAENFRADVEQVAAATGATLVDSGALELTGCNWHPSLKDHRAMADRVEAALAR